MPSGLRAARKAVGAKETLKALERGMAQIVFIAQDADEAVVAPIKELCLRKGVQVVYVESMEGLGRECGITVGASTAAMLK